MRITRIEFVWEVEMVKFEMAYSISRIRLPAMLNCNDNIDSSSVVVEQGKSKFH